MSVGKVLGRIVGGAALGVTAVVAAPVFGAVGTVAAVGAAIGVAGMKKADEKDKNNFKKESYDKGFEAGKASNTSTIIKQEEQIKNLAKQVEKMSKEIVESKGYEEFSTYIIAAFSVALAVANCDGEICSEEREAIQLVIAGEAVKALPQNIKDKIIELAKEPPSFNTALKYALEAETQYLESYDQIIREVVWANGKCADEQYAFIEAWNRALGRNIKVEAC